MDFSKNFSRRAEHIQPAAIRKVLARIQPGTISFTAGKPAPQYFPLKEIYEQTGHILEHVGPDSMQYAATEGLLEMRQWIASRLDHATADNVVLVAGSQQAIDVVAKLFLDEGDKVALTAPTYTAAITTMNVYGAEFLPIESDHEGMLMSSLEAALKQQPKLLYCIPNFMNPTGVSLSLERRHQTVELARKYGVPILEDDPYGDLRFDGEPLPNLYDLAPDIVIYAGTVSKILAPGFRVGWIVAHDSLIGKLTITKQVSDLQVGTYPQTLVNAIIQTGMLDEHIVNLQNYYRKQRDLMVDAIKSHFPPEVKYMIPAGGMFIWCELPAHLDASELLDVALSHKVAFVPGGGFFPNGAGKNTIRLSFSLASADDIQVGIERLGKVFDSVINQE